MTDDLFVYGRDTQRARQHFAAEQRGCCAICGRTSHRLVLDHEHSDKGLCRGLLCESCNFALGFFDDDPERLASALSYLARHDERNGAYESTDDWDERRVKTEVATGRPLPLNPYHRRVRNEQIVAAAQSGQSAKAIALQFNVALSQVYRIVREAEAA